MRSTLLLLLCTFLIASTTVRATDLRGKVEGPAAAASTPAVASTAAAGATFTPPANVPLAGAAVALFVQGENTPAHTTSTDANGVYYFTGINPGSYVLQIHGVNYPLTVQAAGQQDIAIITVQQH